MSFNERKPKTKPRVIRDCANREAPKVVNGARLSLWRRPMGYDKALSMRQTIMEALEAAAVNCEQFADIAETLGLDPDVVTMREVICVALVARAASSTNPKFAQMVIDRVDGPLTIGDSHDSQIVIKPRVVVSQEGKPSDNEC